MGVGMNRIEIEVLRSGAALSGFKQAWRRVAGGRSGAARLAFGNLAQLFSAITEKRLELIRHVAEHEGLNTRKLAAGLKRDYKNVYTDVQALAELGLIEKDERGRLAAPFDEIVIRTRLREAA
jgi:predicted transcriptional regulator